MRTAAGIVIGLSALPGIPKGANSDQEIHFASEKKTIGATPKGDLIAIEKDVKLTKETFKRQNITVVKSVVDTTDSITKPIFKGYLKLLFETDASDIVIYISCHGAAKTGSWCLKTKDPSKGEFVCEYFSPEEMKALWKQYKHRNGAKDRRLFIISDSCHSGAWVTAMASETDVMVQAACGAKEIAIQTFQGGVFTQAWLALDHTCNSNIKQIPKRKIGVFDLPRLTTNLMTKLINRTVVDAIQSVVCFPACLIEELKRNPQPFNPEFSGSKTAWDVGYGLRFIADWKSLSIEKHVSPFTSTVTKHVETSAVGIAKVVLNRTSSLIKGLLRR